MSKAKRRRTMYAMLYSGEKLAVKPIRSYWSYGDELVEVMVATSRHGDYRKGEIIAVGYDWIMYKTRGGRFFVAPRVDVDERIGS